jgi:hypothetical protein
LNKYRRNLDFLEEQCISIGIPLSPFLKGDLGGFLKCDCSRNRILQI